MATRFDVQGDGLSRTANLINYNTAYTISLWAYQVTHNDYGIVQSFYSTVDEPWRNTDQIDQRQVSTDWYFNLNVSIASDELNANTSVIVANATWFHLALVRESVTSAKLYVNGVLGATNTRNVTGRASINQMDLGNRAGDEYFWNGRIAVVKAWTAALTIDEINAEMNIIRPARLTNLYGWWPEFPGSGERARDYSGNGYNWTENGTLTDEDGPPVSWGAPVLIVPYVAAASGDISGAAAGTVTVSGTLTGAGALAGTSAGTVTPAGALTGVGALAGASAGAATVTGTTTGVGALVAAGAGTSTASATLTATGALVGAATGIATDNATLTATGALAGASAGTATDSATLTGEGALSGTAAGTSTATLATSELSQISGTADGTSSATAVIMGIGDLSGAVAGTSTTTGAVTGVGALIATCAGVATVLATLTATGALSGTAAGTSTAVLAIAAAITHYRSTQDVLFSYDSTGAVIMPYEATGAVTFSYESTGEVDVI